MANTVPLNNISGRHVARVLREKPFYRIIDGENRACFDLWQLCTSPNINKFCKFRPGRREGFRVDLLSSSNPADLFERKIGFLPLKFPNGASLAEFAGYDHECYAPVRVITPQKLYKNLDNAFTMIGIESTPDSPQFGFTELYGTILEQGWYGAVFLRNVTRNVDSIYIAKRESPTAIDIDISRDNRFRAGDKIKALVCMTDTPYNEVEVAREFYSIWWEGNSNGALTEYTLEEYVKPAGFKVTLDVYRGEILGDAFGFDRVDINIDTTGLAGGTLRYKVTVSTDNRQNDNVDLKVGSEQMNPNERRKVNISGPKNIPFLFNFNTAFVEVFDTDSGKLLTSSVYQR